MDGYMNGLSEGFLEFCGTLYNPASEQNLLSSSDYQFYGELLDFQPESYFDSGESDQENVYFESQVVPESVKDTPRSKPSHQRTAANMRERQRMKSINDAFQHLRDRIPLGTSLKGDRRVSKVDTLRLAIRYISYLNKMIKNCGDVTGSNRTKRQKEKIIVNYHTATASGAGDDSGFNLIGHSLSCNFPTDVVSRSDGTTTLSAKIWTPETATEADLMIIDS